MDRHIVDISGIRSVNFEPRGEELEIEFADGGICRYQMVPQEIYQELMAAPSKTSYFTQTINERFACVRVDPSLRAD
ncbi:MAG TPA: KTSC domain-containing protein [Gemmatimonadaceae bacterium]